MAVNLLGRSVDRVILHNGVHLGRKLTSRVEKCILRKGCDFAPIPGREMATKMEVCPAGVYVEFPDGHGKLIPFTNMYEADLAPEVKDGK